MTSPWYEWIDVGGRYGPSEPGYVHKFQRAVAHLNAITQEAGDFISEGLHTATGTELEAESDWVILRPGPLRETPGAWPLYLGDFLTNARASLDYLVYDLVRANGHDPGSYTAFPILDSEAKWREDITDRNTAVRGRPPTDGMTEDALALIFDEQPLRHRNPKVRLKDPLMHLLRMSNADKHRRLHVAAFHAGAVQKVWAEPEGIVDVYRTKFAPLKDGPVEADREIARVKVRPCSDAVGRFDPETMIYFGYQRTTQIVFSGPGEPWKAALDDLFGIINSIMRVGRRLERHTKSGSTWFEDLFAGRIGGAHRAPPGH